jgi:hypothetical protein
MEQRTTFIPLPHPVLIAVGCRGALLARCRAAAARVSLELETGDLLSIIEMAASLRPIALLVDADVYGFDPGEFDALARSVGAQRVVVGDQEPMERLVERLGLALTASSRSVSERVEGPTSSKRTAPRSGIRWTAAAGARQTA